MCGLRKNRKEKYLLKFQNNSLQKNDFYFEKFNIVFRLNGRG